MDCHSKYLSFITSPDRRLIQRRVGTKTVNHSRTQAPFSPQVVSQVSKTCHVRVSLSSIRLGWLASDPQRTPCLGLPTVWNSSMTTKPSFFMWVLGVEYGFSCLRGKAPYGLYRQGTSRGISMAQLSTHTQGRQRAF